MARSDIPKGKGFYIYLFGKLKITVSQMVERAAELGAEWIAPKVVGWNTPYWANQDYRQDFVAAMKSNGLTIGGWGYHVGLNRRLQSIARSEAEAAVQAMEDWDLDWYVNNSEKEYKIGWSRLRYGWRKRPEQPLRQAMMDYWERLRILAFDMPVGMTSYRFPEAHPEFVWDEALNAQMCDFAQPQVYAAEDFRERGPAQQLKISYQQYDALGGKMLPFIPLLATYAHGHWRMTPAQIKAFGEMAESLQLPGYAAYTFEHANAGQLEAFGQAWAPPIGEGPPDPEPTPFLSRPESERWQIVRDDLGNRGVIND